MLIYSIEKTGGLTPNTGDCWIRGSVQFNYKTITIPSVYFKSASRTSQLQSITRSLYRTTEFSFFEDHSNCSE